MSRENNRWLPAYITSVDGDKSCDVVFDDGQSETNVTTRKIRLLVGHGDLDGVPGDSDILVEGSAVDARYKGKWATTFSSAVPNAQSTASHPALTGRIFAL